jgi:hypothetical protein
VSTQTCEVMEQNFLRLDKERQSLEKKWHIREHVCMIIDNKHVLNKCKNA